MRPVGSRWQVKLNTGNSAVDICQDGRLIEDHAICRCSGRPSPSRRRSKIASPAFSVTRQETIQIPLDGVQTSGTSSSFLASRRFVNDCGDRRWTRKPSRIVQRKGRSHSGSASTRNVNSGDSVTMPICDASVCRGSRSKHIHTYTRKLASNVEGSRRCRQSWGRVPFRT